MRLSHALAGGILLTVCQLGCTDGILQPNPMEENFDPSFAVAPSEAFTPWSAWGPNSWTLISNGVGTDASMSYSRSGHSVPTVNTWGLATEANRTETVTLPFKYSGFHRGLVRQVFLDVYHTTSIGTTETTLVPLGPVDDESGEFEFTGMVTLSVRRGDIYGFRFGGLVHGRASNTFGMFTVDLPKGPTDKEQCMNGGWQDFRTGPGRGAPQQFINQGQCIRFAETGKELP